MLIFTPFATMPPLLLTHFVLLGLLISFHVLPFVSMLPLEVAPQRLGAAAGHLVLDLLSRRKTKLALGVLAIKAVVKVLPNT